MRVGINVQRRAVAPPRRRRATSPMTSCRGASVAARRNDVIAVAPARRRGRAVAQPRRPCAGGRRHVAKSPMTSVASRGVNGRRSAIVAAVWRRRYQRGRVTGCSPGDRRCRHRRDSWRHASALLSRRHGWRGEQRPAVCTTGGGASAVAAACDSVVVAAPAAATRSDPGPAILHDGRRV